MYDQEFKMKFISYYTKSESLIQRCKKLFEVFEPYEKEWNADLHTRHIDDIRPILNEIIGFRYQSRYLYINIVKQYALWCSSVEHINNVPHDLLNINAEDFENLEKLRQMMVANPTHLQKILDDFLTPESDQNIDNVYRCYCWLAFSGIDEDDMLNVKCSDVDFDNMAIHFNGADYPIYRESIPALRNCAVLDKFVHSHPRYTKKTIINDRIAGDTLIRGVNKRFTKPLIANSFCRRLRKCREDGFSPSYHRLRISGIFYRIHEKEPIEPPDFNALASSMMNDKKCKTVLEPGTKRFRDIKSSSARNLKRDYERWKKVFFG